MRYRMSVIYGHPVIAETRALRFADHVTKRKGGSGDENGRRLKAVIAKALINIDSYCGSKRLIWIGIWCLLHRPIHCTMTLVVILRFLALNYNIFFAIKISVTF